MGKMGTNKWRHCKGRARLEPIRLPRYEVKDKMLMIPQKGRNATFRFAFQTVDRELLSEC